MHRNLSTVAPIADAELLHIVDTAFRDSAQRSGSWLVCRAGCNQCCHGVFAISSLDAARLRSGLAQLNDIDPGRAERVRLRVQGAVQRLRDTYPGDPATGFLATDDASREAFSDFANDEPCPALDPVAGTCDLYAHRPMTCRIFGPPVRSEDGLGCCDLCFQGAPEDAVRAAEMHLPPPELEAGLTVPHGDWTTIVAFALMDREHPSSELAGET